MEEVKDGAGSVSRTPGLNAWDQALIARYLPFYLELESGRRRPTTAAQRHFVLVAHSRARPVTQHEIAFHPNDDTATEIVNFVKAIGSDLVTVVGFPIPNARAW